MYVKKCAKRSLEIASAKKFFALSRTIAASADFALGRKLPVPGNGIGGVMDGLTSTPAWAVTFRMTSLTHDEWAEYLMILAHNLAQVFFKCLNCL
jgi:hypothetical protein